MTVPRTSLEISGESCLSLPDDLGRGEREFMMHWRTSTCGTLARNKSSEWIWQTVVPQEALCHSSLRDALLAVSALHLDFTSGPDRESFLETAESHRSQAVSQLSIHRKTLSSTGSAVFALGTTMTVYSFGIARMWKPTQDNPLDDLCQIFHSIQDLDIPTDIPDWVGAELRPLLKSEAMLIMPDTTQLPILSLRTLNATLSRQDPRHEKAIYDATIQHLSFSFERFMAGGEVAVVAFLWIIRVPSEYIDLIQEKEPFALVILAHYAVILNSLKRQWWMGDWGARVLRAIGEVLNAEWRPALSWVIDSTGCHVPGK